MSTPYTDELVRVANHEYQTFGGVDEADEPLRSRINTYCEDIGFEAPDDIGAYAWSAAFISWCVKTAGAKESEFKFDDTHAEYVKVAIANADAEKGVFRARRIEEHSPKVGDIIHFNRENGRVTYNQARTRRSYPSHCAIVVGFGGSGASRYALTIGGNEGDSVRQNRVALTSDGRVRQRSNNPYISVIETLKTDIGTRARSATRRVATHAPEETADRGRRHEEVSGGPDHGGLEGDGHGAGGRFVCRGSGEGDDYVRSALRSGGKPPVDRTILSPNRSSRSGTDIDHIVVHYTDSSNIEGTISHFKKPSSEVSAHYIVGRDGELVQMVPDAERAWHAGNKPMNGRSIGIEHVAAPGQTMTAAQTGTSIALIDWLMREYAVAFENVIPHVCVKPTDCCGDLFKDFGGGRGLSCSVQRAAVHAWMRANGLGFERGDTVPARFGAEDLPVVHGQRAAGVRRPALRGPVEVAASPRLAMAKSIVDFEARRDSRGRLKVYYLPEGDGGGRYEVAGINERYHKQICDELVELIENGHAEEAEDRAIAYIAAYTDAVADWTGSDGVECYLRDSTFNRGMGGAAWIVQRAVGVETDRRVGPTTLAAIAEAERNPTELIDRLRWARERYEREVVGRGPGNRFWEGLVNRWNNAKTVALRFVHD